MHSGKQRLRQNRVGFFAMFMLAAVMNCANAGAKPKEVLLGLHTAKSGHLGVEIVRMFTAYAEAMEKQTGLPWRVEVENDPGRFLKGLVNKRYQFFWTYQHTNVPGKALAAYKPMVAPTLFGEKQHRACLYVMKTDSVVRVQDLRGKSAMTYDFYLAYLDLRDLLGEAPESFFKILKPVQSGQNSLYALSLGQTGAAFLFSYNIPVFKTLNPGPLKKIREFACSKNQFPISPVFGLAGFSEKIKKDFINLSIGSHQSPAFAKFHSVMKRFGLRWYVPTPKDLKSILELEKKSSGGGWEKAHEHWLETMEWDKNMPPRRMPHS